MTPKEQATELVDSFKSLIPIMEKYPECDKVHKAHKGARNSQAKQCALICINECLKEIDLLEQDERSLWNDNRYKYLQEVKQEINKL